MPDGRDDDQADALAATIATQPASAPTADTRTVDATLIGEAQGSEPPSMPDEAPPRSAGPRSTVGNELRGASVERFTRVDRDRFELLDELARGGLGRVFRARDPRTGRIVAIKEVLRLKEDTILRFAREALVTANLQHPSIVPVYEVGRWPAGEPFIAMKLVEGRTLEALIREAATIEQRMALLAHVIDVADALAYAHAEHVIHRDLKPGNVLVGAYGETVVIDWGLARNVATGEEIDALPTATTIPPDQDQTVEGAVIGTPAYMPPEQAQGEKVDERADVYAIGAILYHALGGVRPFAEASGLGELIAMAATVAPRPLAQHAPGLPPELIAIVEKAMARDPRDRYPSAGELAGDLRRFQAGQLVAAHRYTTGEMVRRWLRRHQVIVAATAVVLAAGIVMGAIAVKGIARERDEANRQRGNAQHARALAEARYADSLEELARQALRAGAPDRALTLLVGANAARGTPTPAAELMARRAAAAFDGLDTIAPGQPGGSLSGFVRGSLLVTADRTGVIRAWDLAAQREVWSKDGAGLIEPAPGGERFLGVDRAGVVRVWSTADGAPIGEWRLPDVAMTRGPALLRWGGDRFAIATPLGVWVGAIDAPALASGEPHDGPVYALEFAPGGGLLASAGADGVLALRDPATGAIRTRLVDGAPSELAAAVWLDDATVVSGDDRGDVRVWDVRAAKVTRRLRQPSAVYGIAVGAGWFASYGDGSVVVVWDAATGAVRHQLGGHVHGTDVAAAWGDTLVTTDEAGHAYVWDPLSGLRLAAIPTEGALPNLWAGTDGLVLFGEARLRVWGTPRGGLVAYPGHTARVRGLEITGGRVWSASHDGSARGVDLASGATLVLGAPGFTEPPLADIPDAPLPTYAHGLRSLRVTPDGATVATTNEDGTIALWDANASATTPRTTWRGHTGRVRQLVFTRDGRTAFSIGDATLRRWDVATGAETGQAPLPDPGWDLVLFDEDRVIAAVTDAAKLVLIDAVALAPIAAFAEPHLPSSLVAAGRHVLIASQTRIAALDATGAMAHEAVFTGASALALGPDGAPDTLVVGGKLGDTTSFSWPELRPLRTWRAEQGVTGVRLRPDGRIVATVSDRFVRLWDPVSALLLDELEAPFLLTQLAWSPDGHHLAAAGASGTVLVWDLTPPAPAALAALSDCVSPWLLDDAALEARPFDPARCP